MDSKINVAILFGGRSPEHQISLLSAQNVYKSLDKSKYNPILIGIDKQGQWHYNSDSMALLNADDPSLIKMADSHNPVLLSQNADVRKLISLDAHDEIARIDVIFPVLHGTFGEDGSVQGFAKLANIACVGCGILGSSVGMDKDIMKRILRDSNIGVAGWKLVRNSTEGIDYADVVSELGNDLFIKPANLGSSVGVSHTKTEADFYKALEEALAFDPKVIIEEKIVGREIEVAVLGNETPIASIPGEIEPTTEFYSFESKYLDESGAILHIPAVLTEKQIKAIQKLAIETYTLLECRGMSRVDMFMTADDELIINEINTIPGFTNISMYPKLWEISGVPQLELITRLIELAIEEHSLQNKLRLV